MSPPEIDWIVPCLYAVWHWVSDGFARGGLLELLKAAAAPIIAIAALRVSQQQVRINDSKLRLDMYERRLKIYRAVREICECLVYTGDISYDDLAKYRRETVETDFLFNRAIRDYVREVGTKAQQYIRARKKYERAKGKKSQEEEGQLYEAADALEEWLTDQLEEVSLKFQILAPEPSP